MGGMSKILRKLNTLLYLLSFFILSTLILTRSVCRKSLAPGFNGVAHLGRGLAVFSVEQYIRPYALEGEE